VFLQPLLRVGIAICLMCSISQFLFNEVINGDLFHHHFLQDIVQPPRMLLPSHQFEACQALVSQSRACQLSYWHLFPCMEVNTTSLVVNCISCMQVMHMHNGALTVSDQLSAHSKHAARRVFFNPMVLTCRTSYFFLFHPNLAKRKPLLRGPKYKSVTACAWL